MGVGVSKFRGKFMSSLLGQSDLQRGHSLSWSMSLLSLLFMSISMFMMFIDLRDWSLSRVVGLVTTFSSGSDWIRVPIKCSVGGAVPTGI